jgi:hypothetical protein
VQDALRKSALKKIKMKWIVPFFIFFLVNGYAQKYMSLSDELREISGLQFIKDTLVVAHNDGGNAPEIFLLKPNGQIIKKVFVANAKNNDWEDISCNSTHIFIADIGNNQNKRQNLQILQISIEDLLTKDTVSAEKMFIQYKEQKAFPPIEKERYFDAECLIYAEGHLWIFTKNRTAPFDGISMIYRFKFEANTSKQITAFGSLKVGKSGWLKDAITAGEFAFGYFYLLTYDRVLKVERSDTEFKILRAKKLPQYKQSEALTIYNEQKLLIGNEKQKYLGSQKLLKFSFE